MHIESTQLTTKAQPTTAFGRIAQFPLIRILLVVLFLAPFLVLHNTVIANLLAGAHEPTRSLLTYGDSVLSVVVLLALYALYTKWVEKRKAVEISTEQATSEFGIGWLLSFAIVAGTVLLMWILGYYSVEDRGAGKVLVDAFFLFGVGAFLQVLIFRLILFRLVEEFVGTWIALVLVAAIFAVAHLTNDNGTLWGTVALATTDVLFAAPFILTRRLWMPWGLHWCWNFTQDGVFGMPNSGVTELPSWITPMVDGPTWITGGSFGIEASLLVVVASFAIGVLLLKMAVARGQILSPSWRRGSR